AVATSSTVLIKRSVCCRNLAAVAGLKPGRVVGIYNRSPSAKAGINSLDKRCHGTKLEASASTLSSTKVVGKRRHSLSSGVYSAIKPRLSGFFCSDGILPRRKYSINTGINVIAKIAAEAIAKVLV